MEDHKKVFFLKTISFSLILKISLHFSIFCSTKEYSQRLIILLILDTKILQSHHDCFGFFTFTPLIFSVLSNPTDILFSQKSWLNFWEQPDFEKENWKKSGSNDSLFLHPFRSSKYYFAILGDNKLFFNLLGKTFGVLKVRWWS